MAERATGILDVHDMQLSLWHTQLESSFRSLGLSSSSSLTETNIASTSTPDLLPKSTQVQPKKNTGSIGQPPVRFRVVEVCEDTTMGTAGSKGKGGGRGGIYVVAKCQIEWASGKTKGKTQDKSRTSMVQTASGSASPQSSGDVFDRPLDPAHNSSPPLLDITSPSVGEQGFVMFSLALPSSSHSYTHSQSVSRTRRQEDTPSHGIIPGVEIVVWQPWQLAEIAVHPSGHLTLPPPDGMSSEAKVAKRKVMLCERFAVL